MKEEKIEQNSSGAVDPQIDGPEKNQEDKVVLPQNQKLKKRRFKPLYLLFAILLIAASAGAGYLGWQYREKVNDNKGLQQRISDLDKQLSDKKKELEAEKAKNKSSSGSSASSTNLTALKENVAASLNSKNTAALEGYMASSLQFVLAASEYGPVVTPSRAVGLVDQYAGQCRTPWDFNLPAATLTGYGSGDYSQYFPANSIVGKSSDSCVISFKINDAGKISVIFFTNNDDLL